MPDDHLLLMDLFQGSDLAFGRTETIGTTEKGKKQGVRCWTEKRTVTAEDWLAHVQGHAGIGIPPLNSRSECRFGAIDVDAYSGIDLAELARQIAKFSYPLVLCRSKSGGPHLFLFMTQWVPAAIMIEKLDALAGALGFGTSEIFPKQIAISTQNEKAPDYGNWINMPYFNGTTNFRYGLDNNGDAITSIAAFVDFCTQRAISAEALEALAVHTDDAIFPEGPPCINSIFSRRTGDYRNISLANAAVYAKKAFPDSWAEKVEEYNRLFPDPLPSAEVEAIKKSYAKKEYRYQCSAQPLCSFCNSTECKKRQFGIGDDETLPNNRSLTVIQTKPPIWYLDVQTVDKTKRISLSTEELQNPRLFQKRCMEVIHQMPPLKKAEHWQRTVQNLLRYLTIVEMPPETSPEGEFIEHLQSFISERKSDNSPEDMLRGCVYHSPLTYMFRWKDFSTYLKNQRFDSLKRHEIMAILKTDLKAQKDFQRLAGTGTNYWEIEKEALVADEPEALQIIKESSPF